MIETQNWDDITVGLSRTGNIEMTFEREDEYDDDETTLIALNRSDAEYLIEELTKAVERLDKRQNSQ
jgi:hypothetical protein